MKKAKILAALTVGVGVACDAYGSANADTAKLAQLQQQLASVNASATFARIPAGTFQMGSPSSESGRYDNEVLHSVTISHGFEMEVTDVTQLQWFRVMGYNPAHFKAQQYCQSDYISMNGTDLCPNNPVEQVSWDDAQAFIAHTALSQPPPGAIVLLLGMSAASVAAVIPQFSQVHNSGENRA